MQEIEDANKTCSWMDIVAVKVLIEYCMLSLWRLIWNAEFSSHRQFFLRFYFTFSERHLVFDNTASDDVCISWAQKIVSFVSTLSFSTCFRAATTNLSQFKRIRSSRTHVYKNKLGRHVSISNLCLSNKCFSLSRARRRSSLSFTISLRHFFVPDLRFSTEYVIVISLLSVAFFRFGAVDSISSHFTFFVYTALSWFIWNSVYASDPQMFSCQKSSTATELERKKQARMTQSFKGKHWQNTPCACLSTAFTDFILPRNNRNNNSVQFFIWRVAKKENQNNWFENKVCWQFRSSHLLRRSMNFPPINPIQIDFKELKILEFQPKQAMSVRCARQYCAHELSLNLTSASSQPIVCF